LKDIDKLEAIGELIAAELMEAASRTKVVSDPAAFLLTHLRRRLGVRSVTVETPSEKKTEKPQKQEITLSADEIQECPDCEGRLVIYPQGKEKGVVMCKHPQLTKEKQAALKQH
jgi:predicted RNA polymerase sigma factor